jgi:hypothetical protein
MTKERLYIELEKIKASVSENFVGAPYMLWYENDPDRNYTCILGQLAINVLGSNCRCEEARAIGGIDFEVNQIIHKMVDMNNDGVPWHTIVDSIVPKLEPAEPGVAEVMEPAAA